MSQAELAAAAGLSASYISLIEAGQRVPREEAIERLSRSLRTTQAELLGNEPASPVFIEMELSHALADVESGRARKALRSLDWLQRRYAGSIEWDLECEVRLAKAVARYRVGDIQRGLAELEELLTEDVPSWVLTSLLRTLSVCYLEVGDLARAIDLAQRGLEQLKSTTPLPSADFAALGVTLASAYRERGDLVSADAISRRVLEITEKEGSPQTRAATYRAASRDAGSRGDMNRALALAARALGAFGEGETRLQLARVQLEYARILLSIDPRRAAEAMGLLAEAAPVLRAAGTSAEGAQCQLQMARGHLATGRPDRATEVAEMVISTSREVPLASAHAQLIIAQVHLLAGRADQAHHALGDARKMLLVTQASWSAAQAWRELGDLYAQADSAREASEAYRRALLLAGLPPMPGPRRLDQADES
jgi:tetratricopeptide (TPR) repeat protein